MKIDVVYPTPVFEDGTVDFDPSVLRSLKAATGAHGIRVNLDPRQKHYAGYIVNSCRDAGFEVRPVLDWPLDAVQASYGQYGAWCMETVARYGFEAVELLNEPWTLNRLPAASYALLVRAACDRLEPGGVKVALACDALRPGGWLDRRWERWWDDVLGAVGDRGSHVAIHPYRSGAMPPGSSRIRWPGWAHRAPWLGARLFPASSMRSHEWNWWRAKAGGRKILVTEVGWNRAEVADQTVAAWLGTEMFDCERRAVERVAVYAYGGDEWGVMDGTNARPQADAMLSAAGRG